MKKYNGPCLWIAAIMFAACSNDDTMPDAPIRGHHFTFEGGVGIETATRASWNDDDGTGSLKFRWDYTPEETVGDEMVMAFLSEGLLASTTGDYHTYANINEHSDYPGDKYWASFKTAKKYQHSIASGQYNGYKVIAVTPLCAENGSAVTSSATAFSATMPMPGTFTQVADQNPEFLRNYMYMYAESTITGGSASLSFKHIPATFRFIITNKRPNEANIKSIQMSLTDATLPVASQSATVNHEAELTFSNDSYTITTLLGESGTAVQTGGKYTAYALALPLADNNAFKNKQIRFVIATDSEPANEYLSFVLDGSLIEGANRTLAGEGAYNWVGGKSYTIRMSLNDVLTVEGITAEPWAAPTEDYEQNLETE